MKIFRICGYGGGRGELVARLAEEFSFRQVGIAAVKYAHKPFDMDKPGSETSNLRQGGCRQTLIANRDRWGLLCETPDQTDPDPVLLAGHLAECDLVLAIGFDNAPLPGLEVMRADNPGEPLCRRDPHIQAVVIDGVPPPGVPYSFAHTDIENIATHILERAVLLPPRTDDRRTAAH
ncbi:molybdopterin-guanine dinucleotide biosynthesis protein B [Candidatus Ferrigenium straubiae]|uniref:molybdopterin-guanine dinucleotide biosynthesis protein B n=1 Tax=Candidatus Ferrigenium straubiae TaxID=2919506 RepID=UPI003F4AF6F1